jgi:hypothetical protein
MKIPEKYFEGCTIVPCTIEFYSGIRRGFRVNFPTGGSIGTETFWGARRAVRKDAKARYLIDKRGF